MHEHLIKWLNDIIKKTERGVPHMLAPRREVVLIIQKFIAMSEKDDYWHGIKTDI